MESLKVIQAGDLHFPEYKGKSIGDLKDEGAPEALIQAIAPTQLQSVMREVAHIAEEPTVCGLLICGDMTSYGDIEEYKNSIKYLNKAVEVGDLTKWPEEALHVVPGNHDVNRSLCDSGEDLYKKFDPLVDSWDQIGRKSILPIEKVRSTEINSSQNSLNLFSLNSCIGCGEKRHLPKEIREELIQIFEDHSVNTSDSNAFKLIGEQLDTPAFEDEHVNSLVRKINEVSSTSVPLVLAHHNILSQVTPRVEIYTELINSGLFRSRLASCSRPVIYCHGHIHDNPVEELKHHQYPSSKVIFVSAPLLYNGFNVIEIEFARNNLPLGCIVHKYRTNPSGAVDNTESVDIPLVDSGMLAKFSDEKLASLLNVCDKNFKRFERIRELIKEDIGRGIHRSTVRDLILEAMWLGLVEIKDRESEYKYWTVRRYEL
jgi:hypothetical protein